MVREITQKSLYVFIGVLLLITSMVFTDSLEASDRFVNTTGSDSGGCTSFSSPCATIQHAIDQASDGDTIKVAQGNYNENISILSMTSSINRLLIQGGWSNDFSTWDMNPSLTIIDGDTTGDGVGDGTVFAIVANNANLDIDLESFTITNGYSPIDSAGGITIYAYNSGIVTSTLKNNIISLNEGEAGGIFTMSGPEFSSGEITLFLTNNIITDNIGRAGGGILAGSTSGLTLTLTNNTIANNRATGACPGGACPGGGIAAWGQLTIDIRNTIVWGNTATGSGDDIYISSGNSAFTNIVNASFSDIGIIENDPSYPGTYNDLGNNINTDPLFVDASNGNYHLASGSQCIDAGDNAAPDIPPTDITGNNRVIDSNNDCEAVVDIGAHEMLNGGGCSLVDIDIKPRSDPNSINLKSKGVIPVAILTTEDFDATTVDPLSVAFGSDGAEEAHGKGHIEDVDEDGDLDLVLHFMIQETGIACGDKEAGLTGETFDGQAIEGFDSINIVKCN